MKEEYRLFKNTMESLENRLAILDNSESDDVKFVLEMDDVRRFVLVMAVSAFDKFIHDVVRRGLIDSFERKRLATKAYLLYKIPISIVQETDIEKRLTKFENYIKEEQQKISYQKLEPAIINGLKLLDDNANFVEIRKWLNDMRDEEFKLNFSNIINRRNLIVHELDMDRSTGLKKEVDSDEIKQNLRFLKDFGEAIYQEYGAENIS